MDITQTDPRAALYLWYAHRRNSAAFYKKLAALIPKSNSRVLDVGCGDGILVLEIAERAAFVVGLDISPTLIEFARQRQIESGKKNVEWVIASVEAPPFCMQSFDHVISCMALRLSNLDQSLPNLRQLVAPHGRIIIEDSVSVPPRFGFWLSHIWKTVRRIPSLYQFYGWQGMWREVKYKFSSAGLQDAHLSTKISPTRFIEIYQRHFPESDQRLDLVPGRLVWENKPKRQ